MLLVVLGAAAAIASALGSGSRAALHGSLVSPLDENAALVSSAAGTAPTQAQCNAIGRRCFAPAAMANAYNYAGLHAAGHNGQGETIAVVDSFGANTIRQDLATFDAAFGLTPMCGEGNLPEDSSGNCASGAPGPHFNIITVQGDPEAKPTGQGNGSTGQEDKSGWDLEVALDVEWAHATAPQANIDLVTTPTAETLGVQGLQQMMNAEQQLIDTHQVDVISQSFGTGEAAFHNGSAAVQQLRQAFIDAQANHVSVFASSGDGGTTNSMKEPVKNPADIPYQSVGWPASDPLVTATGGTYLCVNASTGLGIDNVSPPGGCHKWPGDREPGWVDSGGGYSIWFSRPDYQQNLPAGSSYVGSTPGAPGPNSQMRGVPDVAWESSATTGPLIYSGEAGGWFVIGGTSAASPQWAGVAALADEIAGHDLGFLNPALYAIGANPSQYAADFYDPTNNSNQEPGSSIPGWPASTGWDAVTGLGTPNVANLIPDLIAHSS